MAQLATISVPKDEARRIQRGLIAPLRVDPRHIMKGVLASNFGEGAVRPWRIVDEDECTVHVAGWVGRAADTARIRDQAQDMGGSLRLDGFGPVAGDRVVLDVHASPQVRVRDRARTFSRTEDAATGWPNPAVAYGQWLRDKIDVPRSGVRVLGVDVTSTRPTSGIYRSGMRVVSARVPVVLASVEVEVVEPGTFEQFLQAGVGPLAYLGYGSMVPCGLATRH